MRRTGCVKNKTTSTGWARDGAGCDGYRVFATQHFTSSPASRIRFVLRTSGSEHLWSTHLSVIPALRNLLSYIHSEHIFRLVQHFVLSKVHPTPLNLYEAIACTDCKENGRIVFQSNFICNMNDFACIMNNFFVVVTNNILRTSLR